MKLLIAIIHPEDASNLISELNENKFPATEIETKGSFLKTKNVTIFLGVEDKKVDDVLKIIRKNCKSRTEYISPAPSLTEPGEFIMPTSVKVKIGGATVFILPVEDFKKL